MRRRDLLALMAGAAASLRPLSGATQQRQPVIGVVIAGSIDRVGPMMTGFYRGLSEAGFIVGQNVGIEYRQAEGRYDRLPSLARELVNRSVDVIVTAGGALPTLAAKSATAKIPIVFLSADPIGDRLVTSLARPGGNLTGVSLLGVELIPKRLELLSELVPQTRSVVLLVNPENSNTERIIKDGQDAIRAKGIGLTIAKARSEGEIDRAFAALSQLRASALIIQADPYFTTRRDQLIMLCARYAVPAMYYFRDFVVFGGLISYGASLHGAFQLLGGYVGKILKGANPADLPVEQPTTFELVVNLKTAKALGIAVPPSILTRADEVIE